MLALDLFNTPFERALNEGAVDDLEARRIHHLNTRMLELMSRANDADFKASPAGLAGLKREYQKLKDERDSYYKVREAGIPGSVPTEKIPGKEDLLKGKGRSYYEATGDDKFDAMMGKISKDPWTQLNSDPNWEYEIEELVDQQIEPWLLAMEKSGMPITRDEETLNPGWRKRYEQVANKLAQEFLTSRGLNPRDPDLVGKIRYAIDWHTDESKNVHGQLSAYSDLPLARYAGAFDADGMTANMRDAMVGFIRTDDDDDDEPPTRPMPDNDPRRLDPGNMEEGNFVLASEPENPEEKEKRDAVARAKTAEIAQDHARTRKRDILQSYAQIGRMRTEMIWAIDNYVYMNKEQILDYIDKQSRDPALSALEYMHDLGHDVDGLFKNVTRFLTGTGVSPAKIQAVQNKITKRMGDINERRLAEKIDVVNDPSQARPITRNAQGITTGAVYSGKYDGGIDAKVRAREQWIKLVQAKFPTAKIFQARSINGQVFAILPDGRKIYMRDSLSEAENAISTDAKGRTQQQWIKLVQTKFPTAKIMQAKMIDGPVFAILPDGRKIGWKKVETSNDQKKNSALGEKKLGQLRPKLGTSRDIGKSVKKFRAQRGLDEYISMGSDKNYQEAEPYKNYRIYVRKKPFGPSGMYTAHTEIDRKEFKEPGSSQEEAVQAIRDRIDFVLNAQRKVTGSSTIDFNVKFATDLLADPRQTFYAKLENINGEPKLVIASPEVAGDPELLAAGDFKRSALRNQPDDAGRATPLPGIPLTAKGLRSGDWIANGRYTVGQETQDRDGNRVFDLTYHSTAHTKSDKLRLNQPAFTLGTAREVDEHGGGIGPRQHWQDLMPEQSNPEDYDDYEDEDQETELRSGDYVRDTMDGEHGEIFRMQGDPYERRVRILDRDGKGWYIEPSRLVAVDRNDPDIQRYFGKQRQRDMDEGWKSTVGGAALAGAMALGAGGAQARVAGDNVDNPDVNRLTGKPNVAQTVQGDQAKPTAPSGYSKAYLQSVVDGSHPRPMVSKEKAQELLTQLREQGVSEGLTPGEYHIHTVYFKDGTKKRIRVTSDEVDVADYYTKRGKDVDHVDYDFQIHSDMTEGLKSTLAGAALAGAMALGGAGAAQAQSAAAGSSMPNATTIIQQIQAGKIQNQNDLSSALGDNQSIRQFVFKQLQAKAGLPGHGADSVINALAKKSTAGTQQPGAQQPVKSAGQSGVIVQRPTDNFESRIKEDQDSSGVERAILNRIMVSHTDLLMKFGPDKVMQAAEEVAYNVGDVDEIGTSDVSAYVAQVKQILGATP
jgi:hypothetical protein